MDIIIMHQTVTKHDAIGNDIEGMYTLLKKKYPCFVYAENHFNTMIEYVDEKNMKEMISNPECVVIYHHSVYWDEGYHILKKVKGKIIFRYHNITPPVFFESYNPFHTRQCMLGRKQTERFIREFEEAFWLADSYYNVEDLKGVDSEWIKVCPPFHKIEEWTNKEPDEKILKELIEEDTINLVFVGRIVPNKGHLFLFEVLRVFRMNYTEKIKLRIIGKFDEGLSSYNSVLKRCIREYRLEDSIEFTSEINDSTLMSYYLGSDLMICASEHEGFCVPVIEAQRLGLPVLALNACAVPETLGEGQLLFDKRPELFAAAIHLLAENSDYLEYLSGNGIKNFEERFSRDKIAACFLEAFMEGAKR